MSYTEATVKKDEKGVYIDYDNRKVRPNPPVGWQHVYDNKTQFVKDDIVYFVHRSESTRFVIQDKLLVRDSNIREGNWFIDEDAMRASAKAKVFNKATGRFEDYNGNVEDDMARIFGSRIRKIFRK